MHIINNGRLLPADSYLCHIGECPKHARWFEHVRFYDEVRVYAVCTDHKERLSIAFSEIRRVLQKFQQDAYNAGASFLDEASHKASEST